MAAFEIFFVFLIIFLVIVVFYYYQELFCGMCLGCDCRTCCDRKTDDYNSVKSTPESDELSEAESSEAEFSEEETVELSDSEETTNVPTPIKNEYNSLDLHF